MAISIFFHSDFIPLREPTAPVIVPFKIFETKSFSGISFPSTFNFKLKLGHLTLLLGDS